MKNKKANILLVNGSIRGATGNSGEIIKNAITRIKHEKNTNCSVLTLADPMSGIASIKERFREADGFLIVSGTYWNSWGSPLQRLIEVMSVFENTDVFFGKPVACVVSMDSVGGWEVASRLHAAFSGFGCWSPPCSTLVISRIGQEAVNRTMGSKDDPNEDVWRLDDIKILLKNLIMAAGIHEKWVHWPYEKLKVNEGNWPDTGILDLASPKFL